MKKITSILGLSIAAILVGCTHTPTVEAKSYKNVTLANGKTYAVPESATYTDKPVDAYVVDFYKRMGVQNCVKGDITWEDNTVADEINTIMRTGSKENGKAVYKKAASEGHIGCASPLK